MSTAPSPNAPGGVRARESASAACARAAPAGTATTAAWPLAPRAVQIMAFARTFGACVTQASAAPRVLSARARRAAPRHVATARAACASVPPATSGQSARRKAVPAGATSAVSVRAADASVSLVMAAPTAAVACAPEAARATVRASRTPLVRATLAFEVPIAC